MSGPAAASSGTSSASYDCKYEAGNGGDLKASMKADQVSGQTVDGFIDQGGCIINDSEVGECVTALTREGGLGVGLGDLTLDTIGSEMTFRDTDIQGHNASVDCGLREFPDHVNDLSSVDISISVFDYAFGTTVGGALCTESTDDDHVACEIGTGENEEKQEFCGGEATLINVDLSQANHVVVFLNGPGNQETNCDPTENPIGATTGPDDPYGVSISVVG